ncbi:Brp/Blh family beta-carotene 15,15'-dioxygenase [Idiomarina aminovorans]|uniref:Brp/Blh family beta-carotene 15,15'-dioxygenase n=1 Tax=Idiomarina aminovorans TaxID=2914829 RepID=UPI0020062833|nr:Brp/Blh family beta-carotene 15,15'-dioxygenase [Idiomarina sp. ATCH4]MCK7460179.1 Brp/Blh family beta-carotene 15,15'-dioxygenase [Idiomarina sp. ATCH4]
MAEIDTLSVVALTLATIAGLPHGAMDFFVAKRLQCWRTTTQMILWLTGYMLLAVSVIILWWLSPVTSLSLFLMFSALHFGRDLSSNNDWLAVVIGAVILGLPVYFHPDSVRIYFEALFLTPEQSMALTLAMSWTAQLLLLAVFIHLLRYLHKPSSRHTMLSLCSLIAVAYLTSPLVYFALYFALSHSPKHLIAQWQRLPRNTQRNALKILTVLTLLPVFIGAIVIWLGHLPIQTQTIAVVFIGLAALTFPHMLLIERDIKHNRDNYG